MIWYNHFVSKEWFDITILFGMKSSIKTLEFWGNLKKLENFPPVALNILLGMISLMKLSIFLKINHILKEVGFKL